MWISNPGWRGYPNHAATDGSAAAPSGSGWGDHGTQITLSTTVITNDTITANNNASFTAARGTQSHSTGKFYFELKLITAPSANAIHIGLLDNTVATGASMDTQTLANGVSTYCNDGNAQVDGGSVSGVNLGSAVSLTSGDILGIAFDADHGFHYFSQNGTYFLSGDPSSGASGTGHVGAYTLARNYYPRASIWGLVNCTVQLVTAAGALAHLPAGYTAWG